MLVGLLSLCGAYSAAAHAQMVAVEQPLVDLRLIDFGNTHRAFYNLDDLLVLKRLGKGFMDITGHKNDQPIPVNPRIKYPESAEHADVVKQLMKQIIVENLEDKLRKLTSFHTRYARSEYGRNSSLWLYSQVCACAQGRPDITVELFEHEWEQYSVIARIKGTKHPDNIVVVGAHQDSINLILPSILAAPGADDDGSGTVTTLEVFRILAQGRFVPENTLEFHWYSAEELGLLGSQDVYANYSSSGKDVMAMLQQDMTGYSAGSTQDGSPDVLGIVTDHVHPNLTSFNKMLIENYCDIGYVETTCGYACSDHASASKYGYPSSFVIEAAFSKTNKQIHTTFDVVRNLNFDHMVQHVKLTLAYSVELALHHFEPFS